MMAGIEGVQGGGHHSKDEIERYQDDYKKGLDLFHKSFEEYTKPNVEFHKKEQLKKVMDEALGVMNESASAALKERKIKDEEKLNTDYANFINDPSPENQKKVAEDIQTLSE
ncbi:hypothetical protein [Candidatus Neptunochlamydia vexilliferae]|nr:hypothetical protein [Candidatus Neptunochlamydia vexilliferae]